MAIAGLLPLTIALSTFCFALAAPQQNSSDSVQCGRPAVKPTKPPPGRTIPWVPAIPNRWPWQVSLNVGGDHYCGGSLLDATHVITAAHCFAGKQAADFKIKVGLYDLEAPESQYQTVKVKKLIEHASYQSPMRQSNDVGIMVLETPVQFNRNVSTICVAEKDAAPGKPCITTGWGGNLGPGAEQFLVEVMVPVISNSECNDTDLYGGKIDETMMCAGIADNDSCQGDSGGPFVCQRPDASWELQGVTSWRFGCGPEDKLNVYARVVHFKKWIQDYLKS